jgi:hypothetical protein
MEESPTDQMMEKPVMIQIISHFLTRIGLLSSSEQLKENSIFPSSSPTSLTSLSIPLSHISTLLTYIEQSSYEIPLNLKYLTITKEDVKVSDGQVSQIFVELGLEKELIWEVAKVLGKKGVKGMVGKWLEMVGCDEDGWKYEKVAKPQDGMDVDEQVGNVDRVSAVVLPQAV